MKKLLSIVAVMALAALPLTAQIPEDSPEQSQDVEAAQDLDAGMADSADATAIDSTDVAVPESEGSYEEGDLGADEGELPRTASPLALMALLGVASAGGGLALRRLRAS